MKSLRVQARFNRLKASYLLNTHPLAFRYRWANTCNLLWFGERSACETWRRKTDSPEIQQILSTSNLFRKSPDLRITNALLTSRRYDNANGEIIRLSVEIFFIFLNLVQRYAGCYKRDCRKMQIVELRV